jgi:hypothetical protein
MSKNRAPRQARVKIPGRGRELCELGRRAGTHGKRRPDRANNRRRAIAADYRAG